MAPSWLSGRRIQVVTIFVACALAGLLAVWRFMARAPSLPDHPLRIGFESNPPIQIRTDRGFSGISVETVSEAARRAGIRLQWIETGTSSDEALQKGLVDLWPLMVDLPERRKRVHIARPWMPSGFMLLHRADTPTPDRSFRGRIAVFKLPLNFRLSHERFPNAEIAQISPIADVMKDVCTGRSAAAFLETRVAQSQLRDRPAECLQTELRLQIIPELRLRSGLASTFEMAAAADRIQDEIDNMFRDGTLAFLIAKYSYFGLDDAWASYERTAEELRWRWVTLVACGLTLAVGVVLWQASSLRERKRAEAVLRESEERFRLATRATMDAIWDIDLKTGNVSWNDTYAVLYGRPPETSNSLQWWIDSIHPEDRERTVTDLQTAIGSDVAGWTCEYRFRRANGEWAHIQDRAYIARDANGKARRIIGAMQDLTDWKQAEARLRESEERFRRVFEEGPLGVGLLGRDYRISKVNNALCQMLGYPEDELLEKTFADITHPDDLHNDMDLAGQLFRGEIPSYRMQKRYVKKNGEILWGNLTASILRDHEGRSLTGLGMVEDITEVKRTQEESVVRQKMESLGTLAGGIAHDFNNLLGAVEAQAELALSHLDEGSSCEEELNSIREVAMRGSEIVRQLMIYAGREPGNAEVVNLCSVVAEMLPLLKVSLSKRASMTSELNRDALFIRAGAAQLRQIVMNLLTNASDAMGNRDGAIRVVTRRVSVLKEPAAMPETQPAVDYAVLEVSDNGCGMSVETQDRVFDPFFTTKSAGRGLGLAVVSRIVRDLGGAIRLTSDVGKGTTIEILLPITETPNVTSAHGPSDREKVRPPRQATVLVVEDESTLRDGVARMLRKNGFEVLEAPDGSSAINTLRSNGANIDLILLDMTIPGPSSGEVVAEAVNIRPDMKVVLTSAYPQEMVMDGASTPQVRAFIRKPFQLADLVRTLCDCLNS
jgi:PAS domain S-box-containing protein